MSVLNCPCPTTGSLKDFTDLACKFQLSQVEKFVLFRKGKARFDDLNATTPGTMGIPNPPGDQQAMILADWQTFRTATDDSKMIVTPKVGSSSTFTSGDANTYGGETLNGATIVTSYSASSWEADFFYLSPEQAAEFQTLARCEDLEVIFLMKDKTILASKGEMNANTPPAPTIKGFDIESFQFADVALEGLNDINKHHVTIQLENGWFANAISFKPTWNPLTSL